jgi:hypothetical protein
MFIYRMVRAAQSVPVEVLEHLAKTTIPPAWVHENRYFVSTPSAASQMLQTEWMHAAVELGSGDLADGKAIS